MKAGDIAVLEEALARGYHGGGFRVWDISDKTAPRLLSYVKTHGFGVHRFDMDENYAYISTEMEGYVGNILVIYDLSDPANPREVSRWHMPGQHLAGGETPTWTGYGTRLHHAMRCGDELVGGGLARRVPGAGRQRHDQAHASTAATAFRRRSPNRPTP